MDHRGPRGSWEQELAVPGRRSKVSGFQHLPLPPFRAAQQPDVPVGASLLTTFLPRPRHVHDPIRASQQPPRKARFSPHKRTRMEVPRTEVIGPAASEQQSQDPDPRLLGSSLLFTRPAVDP